MARKKQKYKEFKAGDIFCFPLRENEYGFGRVILDCGSLYKNRKLIDDQSCLYFGNAYTIFIEVFKQRSPTKEFNRSLMDSLIPGIFTTASDIMLGYWDIVDYIKVDYEKIDFPEFLGHLGAFRSSFIKGEIRLEVKIPFEETEKLNLFRSEYGSMKIPEFSLNEFIKVGEIKDAELLDINPQFFSEEDLRFHKERERILSLLPEDIMNQDYYTFSKKRGFDLKRFYE